MSLTRCQKRARLRMVWRTRRKVKKKVITKELKSSLKRHGEEGAWRAVPDQPGHKDWSTVVHGEIGKFKAKAFE